MSVDLEDEKTLLFLPGDRHVLEFVPTRDELLILARSYERERLSLDWNMTWGRLEGLSLV
jgi:hypothetical protein